MSSTLRALVAALVLVVPLAAFQVVSAQQPVISSKTGGKEAGSAISELSQLGGRRVWMVNAPQAECDKLAALGMVVNCDQGRETYGLERSIVIWCQDFDHAIAGKLLAHLGHTDFEQNTHATYPPGTDNAECGMMYEITIRYPIAGISTPVAQAPVAASSSAGMIFSKEGSSAPAASAAPPSTARATGISQLSQLRGRQIWMVNAPLADCAKMEALGMIVDCEQGRETDALANQIVIWCTQFDHAIAGAILSHLGRTHFQQRTHVTEPGSTDDGECGMLYEITMYYPQGG